MRRAWARLGLPMLNASQGWGLAGLSRPAQSTVARQQAAGGRPLALAPSPAFQADLPPAPWRQPGHGITTSTVEAGAGGSRASRRRKDRRKRGAPSGEESSTDEAAGVPVAVVADALSEAELAAESALLRQCPSPLLLEDDQHPIRDHHISRPAWSVLLKLRGAGHEVYIVGGTVRDLLLGQAPKDFDVLTSAEPSHVRKLFSRCYTVGRIFPICHVHVEGALVEVSSFATNADKGRIPRDAAALLSGRSHHGGSRHKSSSANGNLEAAGRSGPTWSGARRVNAVHRDFTVNALFYDPFSRVVFDYVGGVEDCRQRLLRTIGSAEDSFRRDPARMLRAVRLAARAGLELDEGVLGALSTLAPLMATLPQGRLSMELGALLGYGGAARSLELLWRHDLMHLLLPRHAAYLKVRRVGRDYRRRRKPELLFDLMRSLDQHVHPQRPVDACVWVALLAAPLVAKECASLVAKHEAKLQRGQQRQRLWQQQLAAGSLASLDDDECGAAEGAEAASQQEPQQGSTSPGSSSSSTSDWAANSGRQYMESYHEVVREVMEGMLRPLDAGALRKLGLTPEHEAALRQAVLPDLNQGGKEPWLSRRLRRREKRRAERRAERLRKAALAAAEGGELAEPLEELGQWGEEGRGGGSDAEGEGEARGKLGGLGGFGLLGSESTVLVPCSVPKAAVVRAVSLLLAEADLRGRPLPPPHSGRSGADLGLQQAQQQGEAGEGRPEQQQQQQQQQHRHHGQHRLSFEERLVAMLLREFDFADRTRLPVL